jgi:tetratricopeptide (TPR) repeat protein
MRTFPLIAVLIAAVAFAQNPELDKAKALIAEQKWEAAAKSLEIAARAGNSSRESTLKLFEMQGIVFAQLGQATKARESFQALLSLDPRREANSAYSQRVQTAFSAAKQWTNSNSPLEFKSAKAALDAKGRVMQLAAKVKNDGMRLTRKVRFHLRPDEARWSEQDSEIQGNYAAANTEAGGVEWWAELLGENDRVLSMIGSETNPVREGTAIEKAVALSDAPKKEKEEAKVAEEKTAEPDGEPLTPAEDTRDDHEVLVKVERLSSGPPRSLAYGLMGAGAATMVIGLVFGLQSNAARAKVEGAVPNKEGLITDPTQKEAFALNEQAKSQAFAANVLFIAGGAAAVAGGICWLAGSSSQGPSVSVAPTGGGVLVSGGF